MAGLGKGDKGMWRAAFKEHVGPDARQTAGSVKHVACRKAGIKQKQGMICKLTDVDRLAMPYIIRRAAGRQHLELRQTVALEAMIVALQHIDDVNRKMRVAVFKHVQVFGRIRFDQHKLYVRNVLRMAFQELRKHGPDRERGCNDLEYPDITAA